MIKKKFLSNFAELLDTNKFNFEKFVNLLFQKEVVKQKLTDIYNDGNSTQETKKKGVYALYWNGKLMKIGQAADDYSGIFHRMSQYYRGKDGKCEYIDDKNRDDIEVEYITCDSFEECWAIERLLQGLAWSLNEKMPWEKKVRQKTEPSPKNQQKQI